MSSNLSSVHHVHPVSYDRLARLNYQILCIEKVTEPDHEIKLHTSMQKKKDELKQTIVMKHVFIN